jgi:glutathione S-transferase
MSTITLYNYPPSPRSFWMKDLADYLGVDVKSSIAAEDPEFGKHFPLKKCPALITSDGFKLNETVAVISYLVCKSKTKNDFCGSTDEEKALNLKWLSYLNGDLMNPSVIYLTAKIEGKEASPDKLLPALKYIDSELANTKFLSSNSSIFAADIYAYQIITSLKKFGVDISEYHNIIPYLESVSKHPLGN